MSEIRWVVAVPDPVDGLTLWRDPRGDVLELHAPDRAAAVPVARAQGAPLSALVVSRLEYDELRREAQRPPRQTRTPQPSTQPRTA